MDLDGLSAEFPWTVRVSGGFWNESGVFCSGAGISPMDLIAEWTDEPTTPTLWRDMTPEGLASEILDHLNLDENHESGLIPFGTQVFLRKLVERLKPQPVRETVTMIVEIDDDDGEVLISSEAIFRELATITFDLIDGKPDCNSVKMEEL